ncbi:MAG: SseB family protein [Actinomycetota bacterium]|nr:SseB family protein [Actinomycetota bacterium]MDQ3680702.1 SseB family protein [Actinomycetota bacterium]
MSLGNVELVAAIEAVASRDNQVTRRALFETLRRAELVLAVEGDELVLAIGEGDEAYVPAFTDVAAMRAAFPHAYDPRTEQAKVVFELVLAGECAGLALNPAGPIGGILPREDVASLVDNP